MLASTNDNERLYPLDGQSTYFKVLLGVCLTGWIQFSRRSIGHLADTIFHYHC